MLMASHKELVPGVWDEVMAEQEELDPFGCYKLCWQGPLLKILGTPGLNVNQAKADVVVRSPQPNSIITCEAMPYKAQTMCTCRRV